MTLFAAFLICLVINISCEVELKCPNFVECPCGNKGENVSVCVPDGSAYAEVCTRLSKCESCEEGSNTCSKCLEGFEGPFCTLYKGTSASSLIFCRDPGINANSFRRPSVLPTCQGFSPGSRLDYSCDQGYDLDGERSLSCLSSGVWTASLPRCVETPRTQNEVLIYCPDPGTNANSIRRPSTLPTLRGFIQGSDLEYSCDRGYKLSGVRILFCQVSGKWTFNVPRCVNQSTTKDIAENQDQDVCNKDDKIRCRDYGGGYKCIHYECPPNYLRDYDYGYMCRHVIKECPLSDLKCLNEPKIINHFCFTLNSNKRIPKSGQLDLYFGAFLTSKVKDEFILQVKDVKAATGVAPATRDNFHLRETADNLQVVSLTKSVQGGVVWLGVHLETAGQCLIGGKWYSATNPAFLSELKTAVCVCRQSGQRSNPAFVTERNTAITHAVTFRRAICWDNCSVLRVMQSTVTARTYSCAQNMCRHVIKECPLSDLTCLNKPKVINHFCFTLNSNTSIPKSGQLELYFGAFLTSRVKDEFILQVKDVKAPTGVTPATRDNFHLRETEDNRQVVSLTKSVQGPQEIEINLIKKTFRNGAFHLHSKSKLFIVVSEL